MALLDALVPEPSSISWVWVAVGFVVVLALVVGLVILIGRRK